jgi:hypothetical protein
MTRDDTISMLSLLKAAYPSFYAKMSQRDAISVVDLWSEMFADDHVDVVKVALKTLIETHNGFPPDIADVKAEIKTITETALGEKTDAELWAELSDAVVYHSAYAHECREAFEKLSPIVKSYVGSPANLHEMGMSDGNTFNTVTRGLFMKAIPAMRKREEYRAALPPAVREQISKLLKRPGEPTMIAAPTEEDINAARNAVLDALEAVSARGG